MSIDDIRKRIDELDEQLLDLLNERARLARDVGAVKRGAEVPMHDPEREQRVFDRLEQLWNERGGGAAFPKESLRPVFREIMSACLSVEQPLSVAYLGPPGTFTHMAARAAFGLAARYAEATTIAGVFDAVERGAATYGVVPIENSTEGAVTFTLDALLDHELAIRRELITDVSQCLVGSNEDLTTLERVYSHPQALAQCRAWLARNLPTVQLVVSPSTSAAAREASSDQRSAAIASGLAAELHGLSVLRRGIQDRKHNATRFVVLASSDAPRTGHDKTTLVFSTEHERGALRRVLQIFDEEGVNLTRIESRPRGEELWQYVFVTDFEGHRTDPGPGRAVERLREHCSLVKVLGSYPRSG